MKINKRALSVRRQANKSSVWLWCYLSLAVLSGIGLFGKLPLLKRLVHLPIPILVVATAIGLCLPLCWPLAFRLRSFLAPLALAALLAVLLFVFPRVEDLHKVGRGSDQPDCVIIAAKNMMKGRWPYQRAEIWTKNPMSCGPGWVAVQGPVITTLGYPANMVVVWTVSLAVIAFAFGWSDTAAFVVLLCLAPSFWLAAMDGSDFLTFGVAVAAMLAAVERFGNSTPMRFVLATVAGILGQFRMATLLLPAFLTKRIGAKAALMGILISLASETIFIFWNVKSFVVDGPLHIAFKATQHNLFSGSPSLVALELCLPLLIVAGAIILLSSRFRYSLGLVGYFFAVFILPSLLDIVHKRHTYNALLDILQYWEGTLWLSACLPVFALLFLLERRVERSTTSPENRENEKNRDRYKDLAVGVHALN